MIDPVRSTNSALTCDDLRAQGFTHVAVLCTHPGCGFSAYKPFRIYKGPWDVTMADMARRSRCRQCGNRGAECYGWARDVLELPEGTQFVLESPRN